MSPYDLRRPEDLLPFVEAIRRLPDWGIVLDDREEPWFKVPMGQVREGTVIPPTGVALVSIDSEGCEVWMGENLILQGWESGQFVLTLEVGTREQVEQIDLTQLNDED